MKLTLAPSLNQIFERLLRYQVFAPMLLVSLVTVISSALVAGRFFQMQQLNLVSSVAFTVKYFLNEAASHVETLAQASANASLQEIATSLELIARSDESFDAFYYLDEAGQVLLVYPPNERLLMLDMSQQAYFIQAMASGETVISKPFISLRTGHPTIYLAQKVYGKGVVAGELSLFSLQSALASATDLPWNTTVFVTDHAGNLIAHPAAEWVYQQKNLSHLAIIENGRQAEFVDTYFDQGRAYVGASAPILRSGWVVAAQTPFAEIYGPYIFAASSMLLLSILLLFLALRVFTRHMRRRVIQPLGRLGELTGEIAAGNYLIGAQVSQIPDTFSEISTLVENFSLMNQAVLARQQLLEHMASHDALTSLPNRKVFHSSLTQAIAASWEQKSSLAVLFIDLDDFKAVNDAFGHHCGDLLLQKISGEMASRMGDAGVLGRLGGDEFAALLPKVRYVRNAAAIANNLLQIFKLPFHIDGHEIFISASIGISLYPEDGKDADTLIQKADTAMYQTKRRGKNGYQFYSFDMETMAQERIMLTTYLHHAIELGEFALYYQPQISASEPNPGAISSLEALLRWQHPRLGFVPPSRFIPIAEETGLITHLGEWVLREACRQGQAWRAAGLGDWVIAVNISERQLRQQNFLDSLGDIISESGLPSHLLQLEFTENIFYQNLEEITQEIAVIKDMGVTLALDDFGVGNSTLNSLTRIPFDVIKIDRSLVHDIGEDARKTAIVLGVLQMAHSLSLQVVAEGIENINQLAFFHKHGCRLMQGWYFSPALPVEQAENLLRGKAHYPFPRPAQIPVNPKREV